MNGVPITVLLVDDDAARAWLIQQTLLRSPKRPFSVEWVRSLAAARSRLGQVDFETVLLALALPDSMGLASFQQVLEVAPRALILILASATEEGAAQESVLLGAEDYPIQGAEDARGLPRALCYLIERKLARAALHASEARFRAMSDSSPLGIFVSDADGACVYTNAAYQTISGLSLAQTLGDHWQTAIHPEDRPRVLAEWHAIAKGTEDYQSEFRFMRADGSVVWTWVNSAPMAEGDKSMGRVKTVEDITDRKAVEDALFAEKERAQVTLNSIGDAVMTTDLTGNVTYLNQAAETMTGWSREEAAGQPLPKVFAIIDGNTRQEAVNPARQAIEKNVVLALAADSVLVRRDGVELAIEDSAAPIHNRDGRVSGAVIVFHDVSASRAMSQKMAHLARHDFLTDLPNRMLLIEHFSQAIRLAMRHRRQVALMFLDLDSFKNVNDSLGHTIGDQLLQSVATRLCATVRAADMVCRQGGDEFVVLLTEIQYPQDAASVAEKLLSAFALPHHISGHDLHVTLSIGISIYPDDGLSVDTVMQNADTAMYHAKENGRNNYQFFHADMNARAVRRLFVESTLRRALRQDEFILHFQPKIDLIRHVMTGAEALIRWQDPDLGLIYPEQFIPIAEECGLIVPIGRWVLREACRQVQAWLAAGLAAVPVAVNISALEFRHKGFLDGVALALRETGLPPAYLELELTESMLMHEVEASSTVLLALGAMGVKLAIDDFGTGYSSLSYLSRFPINTLKIDQSFMRNIALDTSNATIVSAVIGMGRNLHQRVVAEGVETPDQLAFLRAHLCDEGQGFLFSYPLPAAEFVEWLMPK